MARIEKLPRLDAFPDGRVRGFLDTYINRVIAPRPGHDAHLVATVTFPGLKDVSVFIETPWVDPRYFADVRFWHLVIGHFDDQLPAIIPSVVYFQLDDLLLWGDICLDPRDPALFRRAVATAVEDAALIVGAQPLDTYILGR